MIKMFNRLIVSTLLSVLAITWSSVAMAAADEHAAHHPATATKAEDSAATPAESTGAAMANMEKSKHRWPQFTPPKTPRSVPS